MNASPRVLITRSLPAAATTAKRLKERGFNPLVLPLLQLMPLPSSESDQALLSNFEGDLIFTSATGVRFSPPHLTRRVNTAWCVGPSTAKAAEKAGFKTVRDANGSAKQLIELIQDECDPRLVQFLHLSHAAPRGHIVETLKEDGYSARRISLYDAAPTPNYAKRLAAALKQGEQVDAVMVHSPASGSRLANLWRSEHLGSQMAPPVFAVISEAAADPLREIAGDRLKVAEHPNDTAMIGLIASG